MAENKNKDVMNENEEEMNICYLEDESGKQYKFEVIAECEENGVKYYAMIPVEDDEMDGEFCEYIIMKEVEENGEPSLVEVEDDKEFEKMANIFDDLFDEEIDYDAPAKK